MTDGDMEDLLARGQQAQDAVDVELDKHYEEIFKPGVHVIKTKGDYLFPSIVLAVYRTTAGKLRMTCESTEIPGLLHIFSPAQMSPDRRARESRVRGESVDSQDWTQPHPGGAH